VFANPKEQLFVFDKQKDTEFINNINTTATGRSFYDIPEDWMSDKSADVQAVEKAFSALENYYRPAHSKAIGLGFGDKLDLDTAKVLAHMLRSQFLRTRAARRNGHELHQQIAEDCIEDICERNIPGDEWRKVKPLIAVDERLTGILIGQLIFDASIMDSMVKALLRKHWTFWLNRTENLFITSDHPVSLAVTSERAYEHGVGPASPFGVEVAFPLSPTCLLTVGDRPPLSSPNGHSFYVERERIDLFNHMQVVGSDRYLFGQTNAFQWARKACADYPALREPATNQSQVVSMRDKRISTTAAIFMPRHVAIY